MKRFAWVVLLILGTGVVGCGALKQMAQFREVSFRFDRIAHVALDGLTMEQLRQGKIGPMDIARVGLAMQQGQLPLSFSVVLEAKNPPDNGVTARLAEISWRVYLEDTPLAEGVLSEGITVPPGETVEVAVPVTVNVLDIVQNNLQDALALAGSLAGVGGAPRTVRVEVWPTIETPLGRFRYPKPVVLEKVVGKSERL